MNRDRVAIRRSPEFVAGVFAAADAVDVKSVSVLETHAGAVIPARPYSPVASRDCPARALAAASPHCEA